MTFSFITAQPSLNPAQANPTPAQAARIQAISLDLDDTLWPVWPAIEQAEAELLAWMQAHTPAAARRWAEPGAARAWRAQVEAAHPQRAHDLSFLRLQTIALAMQAAGEQAAPQRAQQAFEVFFAARQRVQPFAEVPQALDWLAARYPLLALSNGNADVLAMPIGRCFAASLPAREAGHAKPDARIFRLGAQRLGLPPQAVLHVGDDPLLDVAGARNAGMQAFWLNREGKSWPAEAGPLPPQAADLLQLCQWLQQVG
ncbi:HAD family hydrolase [Vandammella animalimorsus]|uniref:HAD family hydrolase n=1 Tax=Vandammella animalimorsus TaxID=2029117 RepID=A0A2A2AQW6_9BURK|nr:HAD-IA family hydrolase [Vandammella animalimorsus]PAT40960.1 HAD family hydrolase [Vandammella animalimorsus]